jgi:hypothetical protein
MPLERLTSKYVVGVPDADIFDMVVKATEDCADVFVLNTNTDLLADMAIDKVCAEVDIAVSVIPGARLTDAGRQLVADAFTCRLEDLRLMAGAQGHGTA